MKEIKTGLSFDDVLIVPQYSAVRSRADAKTDSVIAEGYHLGIPVLSANMDTVTEHTMARAMAEAGGLGVIHRNMSIEAQTYEVKQAAKDHYAVAAAIGVNDWEKRAGALVEAGANMLVVDIAHGESEHCVNVVHGLASKDLPVAIVAGNVATTLGVCDLVNAGANIIKVGIGPGAACSTRVMTGVGYPQFSAIMQCAEIANLADVSIIADGGIRTPGDVAKAIAAGADAVMIGSLLAGTDESPGILTGDGKGNLFKAYRGMASTEASGRVHAEGVSGVVKYRGSVKDVVDYLMGGLRSAMSYVGATTIPEFQEKAEFVRITNAGQIESAPHDMKVS